MRGASLATATTLNDDTPDAALAARAANGDDVAFERIMKRHNRLLFRTARSILKSDAEAEDALQEAYLVAWRALGSFRSEARLSTWLVRIVVNEALGRLRRRGAQVLAFDTTIDLADVTWEDVMEDPHGVRVDLVPQAVKAPGTMRPCTLLQDTDRDDDEDMEADVFQNPVTRRPGHDERSQRDDHWKPTLKRLGIRWRKAYNNRHTYATAGLMAGESEGIRPRFVPTDNFALLRKCKNPSKSITCLGL
jgi:RNA polymerase sigma factor (sigma-70 family)